MTRKEVKELLPIIKAFCDGKTIQHLDIIKDKWEDIDEFVYHGSVKSYRIKPEPKCRPFNDAEECWAEMQKHQPFGWVKDRNGSKFVIENIDSRGFVEVYDEGTCNFKEVFENSTFVDGLPFGIKVEE